MPAKRAIAIGGIFGTIAAIATYLVIKAQAVTVTKPQTQACACPPGTSTCNGPGQSCEGNCLQEPIVYLSTDDISFMTTYKYSKPPKSIQGFINGQGGQVFSWTGGQNFFTINYGCGPWPRGTFTFYSVTTFEDGATAKSNVVTFEIQAQTITLAVGCHAPGQIQYSGSVQQDGSGISYVEVDLYQDGVFVTSTTTDQNGNYSALYTTDQNTHTYYTIASGIPSKPQSNTVTIACTSQQQILTTIQLCITNPTNYCGSQCFIIVQNPPFSLTLTSTCLDQNGNPIAGVTLVDSIDGKDLQEMTSPANGQNNWDVQLNDYNPHKFQVVGQYNQNTVYSNIICAQLAPP